MLLQVICEVCHDFRHDHGDYRTGRGVCDFVSVDEGFAAMTMITTIFEQIPDPFVAAYDAQFQTWAREFGRRGRRCCVLFDRPPGTPVLLDGEGRKIQRGVWLQARVEQRADGQKRVIIKPENDFAAELIARHTSEMKRYWFS
jgi:hypothetical protein